MLLDIHNVRRCIHVQYIHNCMSQCLHELTLIEFADVLMNERGYVLHIRSYSELRM